MTTKKLTILIYSLAAIIAFWYWHVDEHFQIFEFASYKLGITPLENLAWEYKAEIRSGILPFIAYIIAKTALFLEIFNPFGVEAFCRWMSTLFFLYVYFRLIPFFISENHPRYYFVLKMCLFFWVLPTIMVRFSSEALSASLFWMGFILLDYRKEKIKPNLLILIGILWGLSFFIRMHIAILIGVTILYVILHNKSRWKDIIYLLTGFFISNGIELAVNYWLYGHIVWSPYGYFIENIIYNKASHFGVEPFYYYLEVLIKYLVYPIGLLIVSGMTYFMLQYRKSIFTWLLLFFIIIHSLIAHKEYRFLFPIFPIMIPMAFMGLTLWLERYFQKANWVYKLIWILNVLLLPSCILIQSFKPYNYLRIYPYTQQYSTIYSDTPTPYALGNIEFYNVRPYFWKSQKCTIVELDSLRSSPEIDCYITTKDYGDSVILQHQTLYKSFQTIPNKWNSVVPESIQKTIDYAYIYEGKSML